MGAATLGSFESGPLVGVATDAGVAAVWVGAGALGAVLDWLPLGSAPTVMVLAGLLEPQPAITAATASAAAPWKIGERGTRRSVGRLRSEGFHARV